MATSAEHRVSVRSFRLRFMAAIMFVVAVTTAAGLYFTQRKALADAERELHGEFRAALEAVNAAQRVRAAHLEQLCRALVDNSRIHAALEDDALDLLYISARDELSGLMTPRRARVPDTAPVHARFYRFLDLEGKVIAPPNAAHGGMIGEEEVELLNLPRLTDVAQIGFVPRGKNLSGADAIDEIIATPIISTDSHQAIAALVVGLEPETTMTRGTEDGITRGIWVRGQLALAGLDAGARTELAALLASRVFKEKSEEGALAIELAGARHLLLCRPLNAGSLYPQAYEIFLYPLAGAAEQEERTRRQILGAGALILLGGFGASHLVAVRMARPVERLAKDSEANALERSRAEAALEMTQAELQRSARFSANASHQLKTPVAVLRAGLDELLVRDDLPPAVREELHNLVGETTRFTSMIEDLLLLSRMDTGRVRIEFARIELVHLIAASLDDLSVLPDPHELKIETRLPEALWIAGEKRYVAHILQNLLENAHRYNRRGGRIEISARLETGTARLMIANTGQAIPREHQAHIFDRFHRGTVAENLPGHGLGLNLARELSRLHGGDVRLVRSEADWTEFEVLFPLDGAEIAASG